MNNFDDIAKKYREEIVNLYKNQNVDGSEYIPSEEENLIDMSQENDEKSDEVYMPPAVAMDSDIYKQNLQNKMGTGFIRIEASSANNALPVSNALVIITQFIDGAERIVRIVETDADGRTELIELSAPLENGTELSPVSPSSSYNAIIFLDGYYEVQNKNIAVFSGITSLQPVNLIPLPANKSEREVITFYEQEPQF
jgi:hypothetical protein